MSDDKSARITRALAAGVVIAALLPLTAAPAQAQYYAPYATPYAYGYAYPPAYRYPYRGYAYPYAYGYPRAFYAPYSGRYHGQPSPTWGIPGGHQPSASSHPPY